MLFLFTVLFAASVQEDIKFLESQIKDSLNKKLSSSEMLNIIEKQMQDLYDIEENITEENPEECERCSEYYYLLEELKKGVEKVMGREGSKVDLTFNSKVISRRHAVIIYKTGKVFIRDTGSSSGTFINNVRLSPIGKESEFIEVRDGDLFQLGETFQQANILHPCVLSKFYLAKSFNGDFIGPEITENIELEYEEILKQFEEKSNILSIFEGRNINVTGSMAKIGSIRPATDEFKRIQQKYNLNPMISDTDMALFSIIDQLLGDYSTNEKASTEYLLNKLKSNSSNTAASLGPLSLSLDKESSTKRLPGFKDKKDAQRATEIKLESIFY